MTKLTGMVSALALTFGLATSASAETSMGIVVKIGGIPWFNAMEDGITRRAEELGVTAEMIGPVSADPALQVQAIEDLIAKGVDVIGVVPNDEAALEPVLQKARDAGIIVISHEGPGLENVDWNFELASAEGFGEAHAKLLSDKTPEGGTYAVYVGSLTVPLHNAWADAAIAWMAENRPDLEIVGDRYGVAENVDDSRSTALDLIAANPDLKGFLAFGSQGPIGAGRAVEERRKTGEIHVMGPFSPGQGRKMIHSGVLTGGFMWNPAQAGEVFVTLGDMLARGETLESGMDVPGLGVIEPDADARDIITDNLLEINASTVDDLAEKGL
ncbi:substrate-binding domain-containing protein [Salipiger marinus]|uniref:substrate-binding domain-containing protein n=1 Tax=Salipiger marinus TaxID=555512 RepID=UPI001E42B699|nr:substrate-binding domain-containing protein [Salipiger manganoxidans]MCD1618016.1 substrate-binding domain-containing protein [Salipiger manganoxidans]MEB3418697.1 substrate-binding domain-containing protein [Salipiger manganoxidans]